MISHRFLPTVCMLLAVALVPTIIHSYSGRATEDLLTSDGIPPMLAGYDSVPSDRAAMWGKRRFNSDDWFQRDYRAVGDDVRLTVVRSFDHKALYHHPELAVAYGPRFGSSFEKYEVIRLDVRPDVAVHVLHPAVGATAMGFYVLHVDGEFIEDPLRFQLRTAVQLLFSRRKLMTLFFAHDLAVPESAEIGSLPSLRLLFAAIDKFVDSDTAAVEKRETGSEVAPAR